MSSLRSGSEGAPLARQLALPMVEASQPGEARRIAAALADELGFDELARGEVSIVVTEAATNLVKHAKDGELLLRTLHVGASRGLEVLAVDRGPGLADVQRAVGDGYSTAGTSGTGLGAIGRLATAFDLHSMPGDGTTMVATLWVNGPAVGARRARTVSCTEAGACELGVVSVPYPGERACGDAWSSHARADVATVIVADGLGHGRLASEAAAAVIASFEHAPEDAPGTVLERAHEAARSTRGAAVAVARVDMRARKVTYAGVGNIAGVVIDGGRQQQMISHNGTVGHQLRKVQEFTYEWPAGAMLVMHSDGLSTSWRLDRYPGLLQRHPALVAATLYRDATRGRDDATVLVLRERAEDAA